MESITLEQLARGLRDAVSMGPPHVAVILLCVVLMLRTASALLRSRFLTHLAGVYVVMGLYYLGDMFVALLRYQLFSPNSVEAVELITRIAKGWEAANLILSFLSTLWLLMVWYMLRHYPEEGVGQKFYIALLGVVPLLSGATIGIVKLAGADPLFVTQVLDPVVSLGVCVLIGFELYRFARREVTVRPYLASALGLFAFSAFVSWGIVQFLYLFRTLGLLEPATPGYVAALIVTKLIAAIAVVVLAAVGLEEKPQFRSTPGQQL